MRNLIPNVINVGENEGLVDIKTDSNDILHIFNEITSVIFFSDVLPQIFLVVSTLLSKLEKKRMPVQ